MLNVTSDIVSCYCGFCKACFILIKLIRELNILVTYDNRFEKLRPDGCPFVGGITVWGHSASFWTW